MRITEKIRFQSPAGRIGRLSERTNKLSLQLSTGKRINQASDDALGALKVETLNARLRRITQHERNLDAGDARLRQTDATLNEATQTLFRSKELAIQGLSAVLTDADANNIANEIAQLREHLQGLANTQSSGRYIFSGFATDTPPYDAAFAYQGDTNRMEIEMDDHVRIAVGVTGGAAFGDGTAATVDVFANLVALEAAVRGRVEDDMQDELERLETSIEQIIGQRTATGISMERVQASRTVNAMLEEQVKTTLAETRDTDFTEAIADLNLVETALQATLSVSGRQVSRSSLLDFLG